MGMLGALERMNLFRSQPLGEYTVHGRILTDHGGRVSAHHTTGDTGTQEAKKQQFSV